MTIATVATTTLSNPTLIALPAFAPGPLTITPPEGAAVPDTARPVEKPGIPAVALESSELRLPKKSDDVNDESKALVV